MKTKRFFLLIVAQLIIVTITNAQLKVRSDNWVQIGYDSYSPIALGNGGTNPNNGQWVIESWNGTLNFARPYPVSNEGNYKFFIRDDNGNVGIGLNNNNPYGKLETYGSKLRFGYTNRPLDINVMALDPRIASVNKVVFYSNSTAAWIDIECKQLIQTSDSARKLNIMQLENSLDKIKKLKGYTYNWKEDPKGKKSAGLIAQEVERVIPEVVVTIDSTGEKLLAYTEIIPYLIEAIKEQQKLIENQQKQIDDLKKSGGSLKSTNTIDDNTLNSSSSLEQNYPNPFSTDTRINMTLSSDIASAYLYIFDMQGTLLKSITINERGSTQVLVKGSELKPGMYIYTLMADGSEIDTKRMVLTE
jgi:hypothetical protein